MKKDSSTVDVILLIFLIGAFFLSIFASSPLPSVSFSWKKIFQKTGLEEQEEARRQLIAQRKEATAQKLKETFEALKAQHELLMENWKINEATARDKNQALNNSVRDFLEKFSQENQKDQQKILEQYHDLEQQRKKMIENRLQSQQELLESFSKMNDQLKNFLDDLLSDLRNQELVKERQRIENQRENLGLIWQSLTENSRAQSTDWEAQFKTVLEDISSGTESNPQKIQTRLKDLEHHRSVMFENTQAAQERVLESSRSWDGQLSLFVNQLAEETAGSLGKSQQNKKDQTTQFENHFKNFLSPRDLQEKQTETARRVEEQRAHLIEQTQIQRDRQKDLKDLTEAQMGNMRDKIQDQPHGL